MKAVSIKRKGGEGIDFYDDDGEEIEKVTVKKSKAKSVEPKKADAVFGLSRKEEDDIIAQALSILERRISKEGVAFTSMNDVKAYFATQMSLYEYEVFSVMFLNRHNCLIAYEEMFRGCVASAAVSPRQVVKRALELNASSIVISHNHPSGRIEPSDDDVVLTRKIISACRVLNIRVVDHIIVGATKTLSFLEKGLLKN